MSTMIERIFDAFVKFVEKKEYVAVLIFVLLFITYMVWDNSKSTTASKNKVDSDFRAAEAALNTLIRKREDSLRNICDQKVAAKDLIIAQKEMERLADRDELIRKFEAGLLKIQPINATSLTRRVKRNSKEIRQIDSINKQLK